jgi:hypothetical protein
MNSAYIPSKVKVLFIYLTLLALVYTPYHSTKANQEVYTVDISTTPTSGFIHALNIAPGDQVSSRLEVQNKGNVDFSYSISSRMESGMELMYDTLHLKISNDDDSILYEGSVSDLQNLPLGSIARSNQKELFFTVALPLNAGNGFQGQLTSVAFDFVASGDPPTDDPPKDDPPKDDPPRDDPPKDDPPKDDPPTDDPPEQETTDQSMEESTSTEEESSSDAFPVDTSSGIKLPDTASPWYNILLINSLLLIGSGIVLWRLRRRKAEKM